MDVEFFTRLIGSSQLIEQRNTLEEGLSELARITAEQLNADKCSIMLLAESDVEEQGDAQLRVYSHYGPLPREAYSEVVHLNEGIAGHVLATNAPLLIDDITKSPFAKAARSQNSGNPSLISAPIRIAAEPIGVINVSGPSDGTILTREHLNLANIFAMFIGKAIHVFQLQKLAESRVLQMTVLQERREQSGHATQPIAPEPAKVARLVAKTLYRELTAAGFGPNGIISVASEVLSELNKSFEKHKTRLEQRQNDDAKKG